MKLTLGFSPCPNDTFIFDALVNGGINTEGLEFDPVLEDVQTLNEWAAVGKLDITKLSFPALFEGLQQYVTLDSGAALGKGVGPLLVAKSPMDMPAVAQSRIAIPGKNTTANFLLSYAFPDAGQKTPMLFSAIEDAVLNNEVDAGVIIHENRFTYQQKGLHKVCDLGEVWEQQEGLPIPLGCIAVKRQLPLHIQQQVQRLITESVRLGFESYPLLSPYIRQHAQAMDEEVMRRHIELYVNDYTLSLGQGGRAAVEQLYEVYLRMSNCNRGEEALFIN